MGIFTRFRDIVSSNINVMLEGAEDPEKLIKLMIREMEDTLVELKASCAGVIAKASKTRRQMDEVQDRIDRWEGRAQLAVNKGRDDLAREALMEKRKYTGRSEDLDREVSELDALVGQYHEDIGQLEEKLLKAREKQRILVQRHIHAVRKRRAQEDIRRIESTDAVMKFEALENRIERMEAEADLVNYGKKPTLEAEFEGLMMDDDIENDLKRLKTSMTGNQERVSQ
ncbi:MAG: phage shock protein A [Desulfobacteraceae bacterium 4572_87]|nr:MAG: phage shock protein A [Desulfobacteraceae bacterium 4572_87]